MSDPKAAAPVARCPLGFTGTPPIGHPSIPGFGSSSSSGDSKLGAEVSAATLGDQVVSTSSSDSWNPATLLALDAVFLGLCIAAAIWWPQTKALLAKFGIDVSRGAAAAQGAGNGAAASAAAGVKQ